MEVGWETYLANSKRGANHRCTQNKTQHWLSSLYRQKFQPSLSDNLKKPQNNLFQHYGAGHAKRIYSTSPLYYNSMKSNLRHDFDRKNCVNDRCFWNFSPIVDNLVAIQAQLSRMGLWSIDAFVWRSFCECLYDIFALKEYFPRACCNRLSVGMSWQMIKTKSQW